MLLTSLYLGLIYLHILKTSFSPLQHLHHFTHVYLYFSPLLLSGGRGISRPFCFVCLSASCVCVFPLKSAVRIDIQNSRAIFSPLSCCSASAARPAASENSASGGDKAVSFSSADNIAQQRPRANVPLFSDLARPPSMTSSLLSLPPTHHVAWVGSARVLTVPGSLSIRRGRPG